jgi:hypothetical protein
LIESLQLGVAQRVPTHADDEQSGFERQTRPSGQRGQVLPPQSVSVSVPFFTMSTQDAATQIFTLLHTMEAQSSGARQARPVPQPGQLPPQSTSVSSPSLVLFTQVMGAQRPPRHTPEAQSVGSAHDRLSAQRAVQPPPQSVSVSLPFFTPSLQLPAWQRPFVHTPVAH